MKNRVGERLLILRRRLMLSQTEVAEALGKAQSNYGRMEKDDGRISVKDLFDLAEILKTTPEMIIGRGEIF